MAVTESLGTIVSASAGTISAYTASGYAAATYKALGELEELPDHGERADTVTFVALADGKTRKAHGAINGGSFELKFARDYSDEGQDILRSAYTSKGEIALKIADSDGNVTYMMVLVMGTPSSMNIGNVVMMTVPVEVTEKAIITVEAS